MAGNILSPVSIWEDFEIPNMLNGVVVSEKKENDIIIQNILIDGRVTEKGQVKIYTTLVRKDGLLTAPAVFMLKEFGGDSVLPTLIGLAKDGYIACTADIEGQKDGEEFFTFYPEDVSYAEYKNVTDRSIIKDGGIKDSCWYEWTAVIKYVLAFLKGLNNVERIGVIGAGESANVIWQVVANNPLVSAMLVFYNGGWQSYKGEYKFMNSAEMRLPDDKLAFIAGVEPQSYAQYVKCPTFLIVNSNDREFEADRAHDTLKRVDNEQKGLLFDSTSFRGLSKESVRTARIFLSDCLMKDNKKIIEPLISSKFVNNECVVEVEVFDERVEKVELYCAEQFIETPFRSYVKINSYKQNGNKFLFKYRPFVESKKVFFFATAKFKNGASISTNIEVVDFSSENVTEKNNSPVIYSGRVDNGESVFLTLDPIDYRDFYISDRETLYAELGPQSIRGVSVKNGIITLSIKEAKHKLKSDGIIMLDVYGKNDCGITIKAYTDFLGSKTEYSYTVSILGSKAWQNIKFDFNKLKTAEGKPFKDFGFVDAVELYADDEVLINNFLWL